MAAVEALRRAAAVLSLTFRRAALELAGRGRGKREHAARPGPYPAGRGSEVRGTTGTMYSVFTNIQSAVLQPGVKRTTLWGARRPPCRGKLRFCAAVALKITAVLKGSRRSFSEKNEVTPKNLIRLLPLFILTDKVAVAANYNQSKKFNVFSFFVKLS